MASFSIITSVVLGFQLASAISVKYSPTEPHASALRQDVGLAHAWPGSGGSNKSSGDAASASASKVEIAVYYEVLCPFCRKLINTSVAQLWDNDEMRSRIELKLVPSGNMKSSRKSQVSEGYKFFHRELETDGFDYVFKCQHGSEECFGNTILACVVEDLQTAENYMPFIMCMETFSEAKSLEWASYDCAKQSGYDTESLRECVTGAKGNRALQNQIEATSKITREYVPWVTLNGVHSAAADKDGEDNEAGHLLSEVCGLLAPPAPALCQDL